MQDIVQSKEAESWEAYKWILRVHLIWIETVCERYFY